MKAHNLRDKKPSKSLPLLISTLNYKANLELIAVLLLRKLQKKDKLSKEHVISNVMKGGACPKSKNNINNNVKLKVLKFRTRKLKFEMFQRMFQKCLLTQFCILLMLRKKKKFLRNQGNQFESWFFPYFMKVKIQMILLFEINL